MKRRLHRIVGGLVDIAEGLAIVLSLGSWSPRWVVRYSVWRIYHDLNSIRKMKGLPPLVRGQYEEEE